MAWLLCAAGEALLFLLPSEEEGMLKELEAKKVPLTRRTFASGKVTAMAPALTALLAKSEDLKATAQAAFVSYLRSIFLHANKAVFDLSKIDIERFAKSLGLPTVPRVRMITKLQKQAGRSSAARSGKAAQLERGNDSERSQDSASDSDEPTSSAAARDGAGEDEGGEDGGGEDLFVVKRADVLQAGDHVAASPGSRCERHTICGCID